MSEITKKQTKQKIKIQIKLHVFRLSEYYVIVFIGAQGFLFKFATAAY